MPRDPPVTSATRPLSENRSLNMRPSDCIARGSGRGGQTSQGREVVRVGSDTIWNPCSTIIRSLAPLGIGIPARKFDLALRGRKIKQRARKNKAGRQAFGGYPSHPPHRVGGEGRALARTGRSCAEYNDRRTSALSQLGQAADASVPIDAERRLCLDRQLTAQLAAASGAPLHPAASPPDHPRGAER